MVIVLYIIAQMHHIKVLLSSFPNKMSQCKVFFFPTGQILATVSALKNVCFPLLIFD